MCEDVARTVHIAKQGGEVVPIAQDNIDRLFDRYQNVYGQNPKERSHDARRRPRRNAGGYEVWFLTGSQGSTARRPSAVEQQSKAVHETLGAARAGEAGVEAGPQGRRRHPPRPHRGQRRRQGHRRDHLDAHVQPREEWFGGRLQALTKPLLCTSTRRGERRAPWGEIDFDFMNLKPGRARRPRVRLRPRPSRCPARHRGRARVRRAGADPRRELDPRCCGAAAVRELKLTRFGDNMRYVAVTRATRPRRRSSSECSGEHLGGERAGRRGGLQQQRTPPRWTRWSRSTTCSTSTWTTCATAVHAAPRSATAPPSSLGLRALSSERLRRVHHELRGLGTLKQLPGLAVQRLMADGYGFGAEGDWKTAVLVRAMNVRRRGLPVALPSWRTTRTTSPRVREDPRRALARGSPTLTTTKPTLEIHRSASAARTTRLRLVFTADARRGRRGRALRHPRRLPSHRDVVDVVPPTEALPNLPWAVPSGSRARRSRSPRRPGSPRAPPTTRHDDRRRPAGRRGLRDDGRHEFLVIDEHTTARGFRDELRLQQAWHRLDRGF